MSKIRKRTDADVSAMLSDQVTVKKVRGQQVVSMIKEPRKSKSLKKAASIDHFSQAGHWAATTLREPGMKALYSKGINSKMSNAHTVALTDYLKGPEIHYVSFKEYSGAIGDKFRIKATDNFQVTKVNVTITDKDGAILETGEAIRDKRKPMMWTYTLTVANPDVVGTVINIVAMDRPGNRAEGTVTIEVYEAG